MSNIAELTESNFEEQVLNSTMPVVLDVYAPWCGPCKALAPLLEKLAQEFEGKAKFVKLNVDEAPGLAAEFSITGVPTLLFVRAGQVQDSIVGFGSPTILKSKIIQLANQTAGAIDLKIRCVYP
jgi:thioredoxin 1